MAESVLAVEPETSVSWRQRFLALVGECGAVSMIRAQVAGGQVCESWLAEVGKDSKRLDEGEATAGSKNKTSWRRTRRNALRMRLLAQGLASL
jgi:hypothetical protein